MQTLMQTFCPARTIAPSKKSTFTGPLEPHRGATVNTLNARNSRSSCVKSVFSPHPVPDCQELRAIGLKVKKSQIKSNKVKINQLNAIPTDLPAFIGKAIDASKPQTPFAHNFSVVSTEKSHSDNMLIYVHLCKIYAKFTFLTPIALQSQDGRGSQRQHRGAIGGKFSLVFVSFC